MEYSQVLENARKNIGPKCKVCPVCNGLGCGNVMPGPGSKAPGNGANDNYKAWRNIKLNMDTLVENTSFCISTDDCTDWFYPAATTATMPSRYLIRIL